MKDHRVPATPEEWQDAVNLAAALRALYDCKLYGLLEGGPVIDVCACDEMIRRGALRGIKPQNTLQLAVEISKECNG